MASIIDTLNGGIDTLKNGVTGALDVVNGITDAVGDIVGINTGNKGETTPVTAPAQQVQVVSVTPWAKYIAIGLGGVVVLLVVKKLLK